jgi:hypothetical protein
MIATNTYKLDVIVGSRPITQHIKDGQSYIEGRKGSEFTLRFKSYSSRRVKVVLSVDGIGVIDGKPAGVKSRGYIVDSFGTIDIPGWTLSQNKVAKFVFRPQGDSQDPTYVEALRQDGIDVDASNQGVIGVMVFPEYYHKPLYHDNHALGMVKTFAATRSFSPASNMLCSAGGPLAASASLGTGFGDEKAFATREVQFTAENPDTPAWFTTIIYDTVANLRKKYGVVIEQYQPDPVNRAFPADNRDYAYVPSAYRRKGL